MSNEEEFAEAFLTMVRTNEFYRAILAAEGYRILADHREPEAQGMTYFGVLMRAAAEQRRMDTVKQVPLRRFASVDELIAHVERLANPPPPDAD